MVMNAFVLGLMRIAKVDQARVEYDGDFANIWLSWDGSAWDEQARLGELCTLRAVRHWIRVWRRSLSLRRRLKRERRLASRVMMQYSRGVEDCTSLVHSFLCD